MRPRSRIRNGYSLVPCEEPRYLAIRRRRVASSLLMRWSRTITQSVTYSSMPKRVSWPSRPRSPVMTVVSPWDLSHRSRRENSARTMASLSRAANSTSMVSSTTRLAPTDWTAAASRMNRPSRSKSPVVMISVGSMWTASIDEAAVGFEGGEVEPEGGGVVGQVGGQLLERQQHAGLVELRGPAHQELDPEEGLARARAAGDQRGPAGGQPAAGQLVEAPDARGHLRQPGPSCRRARRAVVRRGHWTSRVVGGR